MEEVAGFGFCHGCKKEDGHLRFDAVDLRSRSVPWWRVCKGMAAFVQVLGIKEAGNRKEKAMYIYFTRLFM